MIEEGKARSRKRVLLTETAREKVVLRIAIIIGSTRPSRKGEAVAKWVYEIAQERPWQGLAQRAFVSQAA